MPLVRTENYNHLMARSVPIKYVHSLVKLSNATLDELRTELETLGIDPAILDDPSATGAPFIALSRSGAEKPRNITARYTRDQFRM